MKNNHSRLSGRIIGAVFINLTVFLLLFALIIFLAFFVRLLKSGGLAEKVESGNTRAPKKELIVVATAYASQVYQTDSTPCLTANGFDLCRHYADNGTWDSIAANGLKFGTIVKFPELFGDKEFVVRDRMNERYGEYRVDIWIPINEDAKNFGAKRVKMEVY